MKPFGDMTSLVSQRYESRDKVQSSTRATFLQLYMAQLQDQPDAVALVSDESILTYQELDRFATQVALFLWGRGMGLQRLVGICLLRSSPLLIIALLGVLKAGGAYTVLDPSLPDTFWGGE